MLIDGIEYRQPSVAEAVYLVCSSYTKEYRRTCIKFWREHYGDAFALEVEKEVGKHWAKRRKGVRRANTAAATPHE